MRKATFICTLAMMLLTTCELASTQTKTVPKILRNNQTATVEGRVFGKSSTDKNFYFSIKNPEYGQKPIAFKLDNQKGGYTLLVSLKEGDSVSVELRRPELYTIGAQKIYNKEENTYQLNSWDQVRLR